MKKRVIISIAAAAILFAGCSEETKQKTREAAQSAAKDRSQVVEKVQAKSSSMMEEAKEKAAEAMQAAKEKAIELKEHASKSMEEVKKKSSELLDRAKSKATQVETAVKGSLANAAASVEKQAAQVKESLNEKSSASSANGAALYAKCAGCHGTDGKTKALGKSPVIAGEDAENLKKKIEGYKAGTRNAYGMGTLMHTQVSALSESEIDALSEYISKL